MLGRFGSIRRVSGVNTGVNTGKRQIHGDHLFVKSSVANSFITVL